MNYLFLFDGNNSYTNALHCYVYTYIVVLYVFYTVLRTKSDV